LLYRDSFHKPFIWGDGFWILTIMFKEHGTMMEPSKKPLNVLIKQLHGNIEVVLKNGCEYKGKMIKCDGHMNILLEGATEYKDEQALTNYGNVLLRGNNILYIVLDANKH
jgi:small nuclear ribonucleoprotein